ncbi:hypothetical protein [Sinanaerobacter chloroacetimidivorans]|uniref:Uncharacterized protein n=1 Tax=Sinanaerobacter chloroacetimidivorans TaxID=2818044 RepID=A0A8J7VZJ9_9FIRM|nr:hypothetical protein [Sinanaerobacter chloroacetimidivorans]MBR0596878.1 hypothetical protein [Sinanaerobacter chloroacetimidivorans]
MKNRTKRFLSILLAAGLVLSMGGMAAATSPEGEEVTPEAEVSASMSYQNNTVTLQGSGGIQITNGTFTVKELSITPGQDPNGRNYVGQVHTLSNGQFSFEVGRSGSETVASWFNARLSGFNDDSVNGDRTTFDHTAGELNFAFIGDLTLSLTAPGFPQGITVTFSDAAFAQGKSGLSNNWWFGQKQGQHTRDSDGPNRVLAFGTDSSGRTVYASFLRGGNSVSTVSLEALYVPSAAADRAAAIPNVKAAFDALPVNGSLTNLQGFTGNYDAVSCHVQGYTQYDNAEGNRYALLTHSVSTASYAHIVAGTKNGNDKYGFKTYRKDWRHPGGVQGIGDYLLVPTEQETQAHIALYDLRSLPVQELRRVESFDLAVNHKAGALGITTYEDATGTAYYLLIVAHLDESNSVYHIYRAPAAGGLENASFSEVGSFGFEKDFQGFGLVTEEDTNDVYLIGLWSRSEGVSYADYAYLYQIDTRNWTIGEELDQIHMISTGGGIGTFGVHFRYGAGVFVTPDQKLVISATERNRGSSLAVNDWMN